MMVFPLLLMFINIWSVCCLRSIPQTMFKINSVSSTKPGYVTKLEESTEKLESKQGVCELPVCVMGGHLNIISPSCPLISIISTLVDKDELGTELRNVSARVDDLSGRLETQSSCTCKQEIARAEPENVGHVENVEHEKAMASLEEQIAKLKESMLIQEEMVNDLSMRSQDAQNIIGDLTDSTAKLTECANRVLYKVTAFIGTEPYATSHDQVSLRIDGSSETYNIENINDQRRGAGQVNEVFFRSASLGSINSVYMELHGTDGWYIEQLTIDELYSGHISTFDYHSWLDDDGPVSITLPLTSTYNHIST